ncbi:hypothetical protein BH23BAC3_BH23BAC3_28300 [soil metagenome]
MRGNDVNKKSDSLNIPVEDEGSPFIIKLA